MTVASVDLSLSIVRSVDAHRALDGLIFSLSGNMKMISDGFSKLIQPGDMVISQASSFRMAGIQ